MAWGDITVQRLNGEPYKDLAEDTIVRGRADAFGSDRRTKAWSPGDRVKGIALESAVAGQHVRSAPPGSQVEVENGLLPGEVLAPGDPVAVLSSGAFGLADPDNDLPATGSAVDAAVDQTVPVTDPTYQPLVVVLDGAMTTGEGMQTLKQRVFGSTNQLELTSSPGTIWTRYAAGDNFVPRLASPAELFVSSSDALDVGIAVTLVVIRGGGAAIPYEEVRVIDVLLDGQNQVNLTTIDPSLTGVEAPITVNQLNITNDAGSSLITLESDGGGPVGTVYVGTSGDVAGVPNTVLGEIAMSSAGVSIGRSQIAAYTIPAGFSGVGVHDTLQSGFADAFLWLWFKTPGIYEEQSVHVHSSDLQDLNFDPPVLVGSTTLGQVGVPPGTRIEYRGQSKPAAGTGEVSVGFSIALEAIP